MSFKTTVNLLKNTDAKPVGCRICGGELLPAFTPTALMGSVPDEILAVKHSEANGIYNLCNSKGFFSSFTGADFLRITTASGDFPFIIEDINNTYNQIIMVNGSTAMVYFDSRNNPRYNIGATLCCAVVHCGRIFGIDRENKYMLRWSGKNGISSWTVELNEAGNLYLDPARGEARNIFEYGEKLVIARKYGLTLLNAFGSPENFSVDITNTDTDELYRNTAQVLDGKIIFCTASGLHAYDGSVIKKLNHRYEDDIFAPVYSEVYRGKYYLCCKSKSLRRGVVLCYDTEDGESYLIDLPAVALCSADSLIAYVPSQAYRLATGGEYTYSSGEFNFGSGRAKTVTEIFLDGEADVEISNGRLTRKFSGVKGIIRPKLRGTSFTVKLTGSGAVRALTATAEVCNGI